MSNGPVASRLLLGAQLVGATGFALLMVVVMIAQLLHHDVRDAVFMVIGVVGWGSHALFTVRRLRRHRIRSDVSAIL
jgi:hypothetical protein